MNLFRKSIIGYQLIFIFLVFLSSCQDVPEFQVADGLYMVDMDAWKERLGDDSLISLDSRTIMVYVEKKHVLLVAKNFILKNLERTSYPGVGCYYLSSDKLTKRKVMKIVDESVYDLILINDQTFIVEYEGKIIFQFWRTDEHKDKLTFNRLYSDAVNGLGDIDS